MPLFLLAPPTLVAPAGGARAPTSLRATTHTSKQNNDEVTTAVYNVRSGVSTTAGRGGGRALYTLVSINTQRMYIVKVQLKFTAVVGAQV